MRLGLVEKGSIRVKAGLYLNRDKDLAKPKTGYEEDTKE